MEHNSDITDITNLRDQALEELGSANILEALEQWRITYLGRKGRLTNILRGLGSMSQDDRRAMGKVSNVVKAILEEQYEIRKRHIHASEHSVRSSDREDIDITLPGWHKPRGGLHPTSRIVREICDAFRSMGFQIVEGPEVEWDHYNFEMLNIPKNHPARDMWNTLWIDHTNSLEEYPMLLRTHTSPMQARTMEKSDPPIRVVVPGKCYRYEATDATHEWHFYQIEGLAVDKNITFADLKGTLFEFARQLFGEERKIRFRCDYFPFVEPGVDMSIDCFSCEGKGCRICSETGWIEIMGAGMVHPKVLEAVGYDPLIYTGFAFGMGPERIAMLKYGIEDIRLFYSNDLRFLNQF